MKIDLKAFNSQGFELKGAHTNSNQYTVKVNQSRANVIKAAHKANGFIVVEAGTVTGSATIEVTSNTDSRVSQTIQVDVIDKGYNATVHIQGYYKPNIRTINQL